jgi:hypothetical protein
MDHTSKPQTLENPCYNSCSGPKYLVTCCLVEDDVPDGGLRAWSVVLGSFFGLFASFGVVNSYVIIFVHSMAGTLKTWESIRESFKNITQ